MSGYSVFITQDLLQTCTLHGHLVARRLRLSLLDRSIAPEFRATQISAGPTMARSIWKRENRKTATDTYSCRPRRALLCLALYWITAAKLRPSPAYRQDDTMPFRRPSNALESLVPGSNDPACRARSLFVSAGECQGADTAVCSYMATTRANFESCGYCILSARRVAPGTRFERKRLKMQIK